MVANWMMLVSLLHVLNWMSSEKKWCRLFNWGCRREIFWDLSRPSILVPEIPWSNA